MASERPEGLSSEAIYASIVAASYVDKLQVVANVKFSMGRDVTKKDARDVMREAVAIAEQGAEAFRHVAGLGKQTARRRRL